MVDSPTLDEASIENALRGAALWLTPKVVWGFDAADFAFLSDLERTELSDSVASFLAVADQVPPNRPATSEQIESALPALLRIIQITRPDIYGDSDAFAAGKQIERQLTGKLPAWVRQLKFETGSDASGDAALWVWVIADDDAVRDGALRDNTRMVRQVIDDAVSRSGLNYWTYVRFRSMSEQAEQVAESR